MTTVWGDGFADDGWSDFLAVRSWETCTTDELVRYFPHLSMGEGGMSRQALMRLDEQIARHAAGRSQTGTLDNTWWARDRRRSKAFRMPWHSARHDGSAVEERRAVVFLQDVMDAIRSGSLGSPDEALVTTFAFHAGIHPAYLWPKAVLSHERETAACWLGHVARGRAALLPADLADYLLDVVERRCGSAVFRDQHLERATAGSVDVDAIAFAAARRATGRRVVVRQRRAPRAVAVPSDPYLSGFPGIHGAGKRRDDQASAWRPPDAALRQDPALPQA